MSKPTIILLSGWKRSGKDTVADYLVKEFGYKRLGFADPLKDLTATLFDIKRNYFDDAALKESPIMYMPVQAKDDFAALVTTAMTKEFKLSHDVGDLQDYWTPRALCILVGSCMRAVNPNFWVDQALNQVKPGGLYVISDCRYRSEVEAVKRFNAHVTTVRIDRFDSSPSVDPSERDLDDYSFDIILENRTTIKDLLTKVEMLGGVI